MSRPSPWSPPNYPEIVLDWRRPAARVGWEIEVRYRSSDGVEQRVLRTTLAPRGAAQASFRVRTDRFRPDLAVGGLVRLSDAAGDGLVLESLTGPRGVVGRTVLESPPAPSPRPAVRRDSAAQEPRPAPTPRTADDAPGPEAPDVGQDEPTPSTDSAATPAEPEPRSRPSEEAADGDSSADDAPAPSPKRTRSRKRPRRRS